MGLPSLLVTLSQNQEGCAQYLHRHGIAISLGWQSQVQPAETATVLGALATDHGRRIEMSARGRVLIDGHGAERVVRAMSAVANEHRRERR